MTVRRVASWRQRSSYRHATATLIAVMGCFALLGAAAPAVVHAAATVSFDLSGVDLSIPAGTARQLKIRASGTVTPLGTGSIMFNFNVTPIDSLSNPAQNPTDYTLTVAPTAVPITLTSGGTGLTASFSGDAATVTISTKVGTLPDKNLTLRLSAVSVSTCVVSTEGSFNCSAEPVTIGSPDQAAFVIREPAPPAAIANISNTEQCGVSSGALNPFVASVTNANSSTRVIWSTNTSGAALSASSTTVSGGQSQPTTLTFPAANPPPAEGVAVTASLAANGTAVPNSSRSFTIPSCPATIAVFNGNNQTGRPGQSPPAQLDVLVTQGTTTVPLRATNVTWAVTSDQTGGATVSPSPVATDVNGRARTTLTFGSNPSGGRTNVTASVTFPPGTTRSAVFDNLRSEEPESLRISTASPTASATVGTSAALQVRVESNRPLPPTVAWSIVPGTDRTGGASIPASSPVGAGGTSTNTVRLGPNPGTVQVRAAVFTADTPPREVSLVFTVTATEVQRTIAIVSGNNQVGVVNATLGAPLVVQVTPAAQNVRILWTIAGGATLLDGPETLTDASGRASNRVRLGSTPGQAVSVTAALPEGAGGATAVFQVNDASLIAIEGLKTHAVLGNLAVTTATVQAKNIGLRLAALRRGSGGGVSVSGLSMNVAGGSLPLDMVTSFLRSGGGGGASADPTKIFGGLGIFLNGQGSFGDQDGTSREPSFTFNTQGLTLGSDYRLSDNLVLGAALGYLRTDSDIDAGGRVKMSGYSLSAFGSYYIGEKLYVDAIATYGWNGFDVTRKVALDDTTAVAKGDPDANQLTLSVSGGYNFSFGPLTVGPTAKVTYINVHIDAFQERGADVFNLRVNRQRVESLATDLGVQLSYAINTPWGVLLPLARAEWEHEFKGGSRLITGSLVADPLGTTFGTPTDSPDRNYVNLAVGMTATLPRGVSAFAHYETVLGRANVTNHSFTAGVRFQFD